jgi:hypothetical protein
MQPRHRPRIEKCQMLKQVHDNKGLFPGLVIPNLFRDLVLREARYV